MNTPDYSQVESYLNGFVNYEALPGFGFAEAGYDLSHVRELLHRLGDPHFGPRTVHVAGSKGKGSVSAMTASALTACGHVTGLYTSPHLIHLGERIRVDGRCITPQELLAAVETVRVAVEQMRREGKWRPFSYFELLTVMAFIHFRIKAVEVQVVEVGLGGRLDATNVVSPDVCVITPISLEHTTVLGDTIAQIAVEKAGIIKPGATVVSAPQHPEVMAVIRSACCSSGASLVRVGEEISWEACQRSIDGQTVTAVVLRNRHTVRIPLIATYEAENAVAALGALNALTCRGVALDVDCVADGMRIIKWPGRFQVLARKPLLVLDGAHNPASMRRLAENVALLQSIGELVYVLGFSSDKDVIGSVAELSQTGGRILLTCSSQPRALALEELASRITGLGLAVRCIPSIGEALKQARDEAGASGMVVVAGSLYLVAEVLEGWQRDDRALLHWETDPSALTREPGRK